MARQEIASVSRPPISGPAALPKPAAPMISPPARPAFFSGSRLNVMASVAGHISAPPRPMSARHRISQMSLGAAAASRENPTNTAEPVKNIRRRPNMSASRPPVIMNTPNTSA